MPLDVIVQFCYRKVVYKAVAYGQFFNSLVRLFYSNATFFSRLAYMQCVLILQNL